MARRIVDYIFKVSRDDVGPRFNALTLSQRGFTQDSRRTWKSYEQFAKRSLSNVSRHGKTQFQKLSREARSQLGGKIAGALGAAAIGVALKKSLTDLAALGDEMTGIAIKLRRPVESLADVKREIESFSFKRGIVDDAAEIARGVNLLVGADFQLADSLTIVKKASQAAAAQQTRTGIVTKATADILKGFKLEASDVDDILSQMIVAVDSGVIEFEDLSGAIGQVISPAKKAKASLAEVLGLMETLSVTGLSNASENSTAVARLLDRFTNIEFAKKARKFGIQIFDKKGQLNSPIAILEQTGKRINRLGTDAKRLNLLGKLFGTDIRASRALLPLIDNMDALKRTIEKIERAPGRLAEAFEESQKRLSVSGAKFKNTLSFLSRDVATLFEPGIDMFSKWVEENFDPISGGKTLADRTREMIQLAAETAEKEQWGLKFWKLVLLDPLKGLIIHGLKTNTFSLIAATAFTATSLALKSIDNSLNPKDQGEAQKEVFIGGQRIPLARKKKNEPSVVTQARERLIRAAAQSQRQEIRREGKQQIIFKPKININQKIDTATGKTQTEISIADPVDIERRIPLGVTP